MRAGLRSLLSICVLGASAVACRRASPSLIPCGSLSCDATSQYCEIYLSDVPDPPTDYECRPLPAACKPDHGERRPCDCFPAETPCLSFCGPLPSSGKTEGFHLTCQGKKKP